MDLNDSNDQPQKSNDQSQPEQFNKNASTELETKKSKILRVPWKKKEDTLLFKVIREIGTNWIQVAKAFKNRNPSQCAQRWKRIKPDSLRNRCQWNNAEDQQLLSLVEEYDRNWKEIAKHMPERSGKQIRERYINKLNPNINRLPWTKEEDMKILNGFKDMGSKWTEIAKLLSGRPENTIKNRFYSYIRKHYLNIENPYYVIPAEKVELQQLKSNFELNVEGVKVQDSKSKNSNKNWKITKKVISCLEKQTDVDQDKHILHKMLINQKMLAQQSNINNNNIFFQIENEENNTNNGMKIEESFEQKTYYSYVAYQNPQYQYFLQWMTLLRQQQQQQQQQQYQQQQQQQQQQNCYYYSNNSFSKNIYQNLTQQSFIVKEE